MPDIPLPPIQEVQPAQAGAGKLDIGAATAPYAAMQGLGRSVQDVGQVLGNIALDQQQHINNGILANEETIRQQTYADIQQYMMKNQGSPESWEGYAKDKWQEYQDGKMDRMQSQGWGEQVKFADKLQTQDFQRRANIEFEAEQSKAMIGQANARLEVQAKQFVDAGDEASAKTLIGKMDLNEEQRIATITRIVKWGALQNANRALEADPFTAEQQLADPKNFASLLPADRAMMLFRAHKLAAETRTNTQRDMMQQVSMAQSGAGDMPDRETFDSIAQHQGISPKFVDALFKAPKADDSPENYAKVLSDIQSYDPSKPDPAKEWEIGKAMQGLNPVSKARLDELWKLKTDPNSKMNSEGYKYGVSTINDAFEKGLYGTWKQAGRDPDTGEWRETTNKDTYAKAMIEKANTLTAFMDYMKQNPAATPSDIQKQLGVIHRTTVVNNGTALMLKDPTLLPTASTPAADADRLKATLKKFNISQ